MFPSQVFNPITGLCSFSRFKAESQSLIREQRCPSVQSSLISLIIHDKIMMSKTNYIERHCMSTEARTYKCIFIEFQRARIFLHTTNQKSCFISKMGSSWAASSKVLTASLQQRFDLNTIPQI